MIALRPSHAHSDGGVVPFVAMLLFSLLLFAAFMGLVFWIISARGKEVRARAERAFGPLGITGARYLFTSWRGAGVWAGRQLSVTLTAGQRRSPPSMFVELSSATRFDLTVGPPMGDTARWVRDKITSDVEISAPQLPGISLFTNDPSRGQATVNAAAPAIQRIMTPLTGGQLRWVFVRAGVVKFQIIGYAWQTLTPQSARADLESLLAIAQAAEH